MRRALFAVGPVLLAAITVFACGEDGKGPASPAFVLDGSTPSTQTGFDANVDAPGPDVVSTSVTVVVTNSMGPKANIRVVFHDAAGAVLETMVTGADGKATSTGATPAMASALLGNISTPHIMTWTAVEKGDELRVRDLDSVEPIGAYTVTLPGIFTDAGATLYEANAGWCAMTPEGGGAINLELRRECVGAKGSVLGVARDDNYAIVGYSFAKGNAVPTDGGAIPVATKEWKLPTSFALTIMNPPETTSVYSDLIEIADGVGFKNEARSRATGTPVTWKTANAFADALQPSIYAYSGGSQQFITRRIAPAPSLTIDAAQFLPAITSTSMVATDPRRPVISWVSTSTAGADGGLVQVQFSGQVQFSWHYWTFVVPPGALGVTAPAMPVEAAAFLPAADAGPETFFSPPQVLFIEADVLPSYALFRREQGTIVGLERGFGGYSLPALPANGTYRATGYVKPP